MTESDQVPLPLIPNFPNMSQISTSGRALTFGCLYDFCEGKKDICDIGDTADKLLLLEHEIATDAYREAVGFTHDVLGFVPETPTQRLLSLERHRAELAELYIELGLLLADIKLLQ